MTFREYHNRQQILMESDANPAFEALKDLSKIDDVDKLNGYIKDLEDYRDNAYKLDNQELALDASEGIKKIKERIKELEDSSEPETEAETEPETEAETEPETEAETEPETEAEPREETPEVEDISTDYQYIYNNIKFFKTALKNITKNRGTINSFLESNQDDMAYYLMAEIACDKFIRSRSELSTGHNPPTIRVGRTEYSLSLANKQIQAYKDGKLIKNDSPNNILVLDFLKTLNDLHSHKVGYDKLRNYPTINEYITKHKNINIDKNTLSIIKKDINSIRSQEEAESESATLDRTDREETGPRPTSTSTPTSTPADEEDSGSTSTLDASEYERLNNDYGITQSDDNDFLTVSKLTTNSKSKEIEKAISNTFGGVTGEEKGLVFLKAIERANEAKKKLMKKGQKDKNKIESTRSIERDLEETVIFRELRTNPLLSEEYEILKERLSLTGRGAQRSWGRKLGRDFNNPGNGTDDTETGAEVGDIEKYRQKMAKKAYDIFNKNLNSDHIDLYKKNEDIKRLKALASKYVFGLNDKINSLIRRNDYGVIGGFVRDLRLAHADKVEERNAAYVGTKKGQIRMELENHILSGLDKLNESGKIKPEQKEILSACAFLPLSMLDRKYKGENLADQIIEFAKRNITNYFSKNNLKHLGTVLQKNASMYSNILDKSLALEVKKQIIKENNLDINSSGSSNSTNQPISPEAQEEQINYWRQALTDLFNNDASGAGATEEQNSVVTEENKIIQKNASRGANETGIALLKAMSMDKQTAAEGKKWIVDNIYKGNPNAGKIIDDFVKKNMNKRGKAAQLLNKKLGKAPAAPATPATPATQQPSPNGIPAQATVTTAASDGFPNRLYKKLIRRRIGM